MSLLSKVRQHKVIKIKGIKYKIRKINPYLDFPQDKMPQIFTSFQSRRKVDDKEQQNEKAIRRGYEDMKNMIVSGVIEPKLGDGLTIDDLMCDMDTAFKLYTEILVHSLNRFSGTLKSVFFSAKLKRTIYTLWQKNMENNQSNSFAPTEITQ